MADLTLNWTIFLMKNQKKSQISKKYIYLIYIIWYSKKDTLILHNFDVKKLETFYLGHNITEEIKHYFKVF